MEGRWDPPKRPPLIFEKQLKSADDWTESLLKDNEQLLCKLQTELNQGSFMNLSSQAQLKLNLACLLAVWNRHYKHFLYVLGPNARDRYEGEEIILEVPRYEEGEDEENESEGESDDILSSTQSSFNPSESPPSGDADLIEDKDSSHYARWTVEELARLREGATLYGARSFDKIAEHIGTRTMEQVRSKLYRHKMKQEEKARMDKKRNLLNI